MLNSRINLKSTSKDELLLSVLIEKVDSYIVDLDDVRQNLELDNDLKGKVSFRLNKGNNFINLKVSPNKISGSSDNMRLNVFISPDDESILQIVVATVDNPYVVSTEDDSSRAAKNRYIIKHDTKKPKSNDDLINISDKEPILQ